MDNNSSAAVTPAEPCCSVTAEQFIGFVVFDAFIFLGIIAGNMLVVMSVMSYAKMRSPTNVFLTSLAVADLFVAFVCLPCDILFALGVLGDVSPWTCLVGSQLTCVSFSVSVNNLAVVAYDRYLAITRPLHYYTQMSPRRTRNLILVAWSVAIFYNLLPFFGWNQLDTYDLGYCDLVYIHPFNYRCVGAVTLWFIPFIIMGYFYFRIFLVARQQHRRIAAEIHAAHRAPQTLTLELKAAKTVALVLGIFLLAFTPATLVCLADVLFSTSELFIYEIFFFHLLFSNSAMNPVTYACRSREFRWAFVKLLGAVFPCKCWQKLSERVTHSLTGDPCDSVVTINKDQTSDGGEDLATPSTSETKAHITTPGSSVYLQNDDAAPPKLWYIDLG